MYAAFEIYSKENNVFPIKYMYTGVRIKTILTLTLILTFSACFNTHCDKEINLF